MKIVWILGCSNIWKIILQIACFSKASLWSVRNMNTILIILNRIMNELMSSHLWSWRNVRRCIFMLTWWLVFLLSIEHLVFVSVNISTSGVDWWSLITSFSSSRWLSRMRLNFLLSSHNFWRRDICVSWSLTLILIPLRWNLRSSFDWRLYSYISFALKSRLRCFFHIFLAMFAKINGVLLNLILVDSW